MWKRQVFAFHVALGGALFTLVALLSLELLWAFGAACVTVGAAAAARAWARHDPTPMPYGMRWILSAPRPFRSPKRLKSILAFRGGERLLEIGPGTGAHVLSVATLLGPDGILDVLDIQKEMLDELLRRATRAGVGNILAIRGNAGRLPYRDTAFDGAYAISVLGEIPVSDEALRTRAGGAPRCDFRFRVAPRLTGPGPIGGAS